MRLAEVSVLLGECHFSFYDYLVRTPEDKKKLTDAYDIDCEHVYAGFEDMLVSEVPAPRLWTFLEELRDSGDNGKLIIPVKQPADEVVRQLAKTALGGKKGAGWGARLLEQCPIEDLPKTAMNFLFQVYGVFPPPPAMPKPAAAPVVPAAPEPPVSVQAKLAVPAPPKPAE